MIRVCHFSIFCGNLGLYKKKCFNSNVVNLILFVRYFYVGSNFWIYHLIFAATCPPISLDNGSVLYLQPEVNGEYRPGTPARFTCDPGFVRNGPRIW